MSLFIPHSMISLIYIAREFLKKSLKFIREAYTKNETLGDVINYLNECDQNYRLFSNNCQDLASGFYAKFAKIHVEELRQDLHKRYNTPGLSRGIDDSVTVTCTLF